MMPAVTAQMWIPTAMVEKVEPLGNQRTSGRSTGATRLERRGRHWMWLKGRMQARRRRRAGARRVRRASRTGWPTSIPETNAQERISVVPTHGRAHQPRRRQDRRARRAGARRRRRARADRRVRQPREPHAGARGRPHAARSPCASRSVPRAVALVRQLLTESMVLALAGGAIALPIAAGLAGADRQRAAAAAYRPRAGQSRPDWRVLVFTLAASVATGVVFGLIPALRASRPDLVPALKDAGEADARDAASSCATRWSSCRWPCRSCSSSAARCWCAASPWRGEWISATTATARRSLASRSR